MLDWMKYVTIANRFQFRARLEDREDLRQNIILALGRAQLHDGNNGSGNLSERKLLQIARYECQKYWREIRRNRRVVSLNMVFENSDGGGIELSDTVPDSEAVNLDSWIDAKNQLLACPKRILDIASRSLRGQSLNNRDYQCLWRYRHKHSH